MVPVVWIPPPWLNRLPSLINIGLADEVPMRATLTEYDLNHHTNFEAKVFGGR
jgi:hypothetical protein